MVCEVDYFRFKKWDNDRFSRDFESKMIGVDSWIKYLWMDRILRGTDQHTRLPRFKREDLSALDLFVSHFDCLSVWATFPQLDDVKKGRILFVY
jgi:hypothetical protein